MLEFEFSHLNSVMKGTLLNDYLELRMRLMAHQCFLCALLASHHDKETLSAYLVEVLDQMQSHHLASALDDSLLSVFEREVQLILNKAGLPMQADG